MLAVASGENIKHFIRTQKSKNLCLLNFLGFVRVKIFADTKLSKFEECFKMRLLAYYEFLAGSQLDINNRL